MGFETIGCCSTTFGIRKTIETLQDSKIDDKDRLIKELEEVYIKISLNLDPKNLHLLQNWEIKNVIFKMNFTSSEFEIKKLKSKHMQNLCHIQWFQKWQFLNLKLGAKF